MENTVYIRRMSSTIFQEIKYSNFNDLKDKLELMIRYNDSDILIQLLINNEFLNNHVNIDRLILEKLDKNDISIIFNNKKNLYCLGEKNGKYLLDDNRKDNYSELLRFIIKNANEISYELIMNNSYKDLILLAIKHDIYMLMYISIELKNDEEIMSFAIKRNQVGLKYASVELQNNKEFVLKAIRYHGAALNYAAPQFKNDKEIVLKAVKKNAWIIHCINIELQNDKEIILEAVKQDGQALSIVNIEFKNDKEVVLEAVKQNKSSLCYASINLQNDEDIILAAK